MKFQIGQRVTLVNLNDIPEHLSKYGDFWKEYFSKRQGQLYTIMKHHSHKSIHEDYAMYTIHDCNGEQPKDGDDNNCKMWVYELIPYTDPLPNELFTI